MALVNSAPGLHFSCRQQSNLTEWPKVQSRGNRLSSKGAAMAGQPSLEMGTPQHSDQRNSI